MQDNDIDFIIDKFREDTFSVNANWRMLKAKVGFRHRRIWVAAAVGAVIVFSATAAFFTYRHISTAEKVELTTHEASVDGNDDVFQPKLMVFESSKLSNVIEVIEAEYGVKIGNVPLNSNEYVLTLRYEGTPAELIDAINEILDTHLTVEEI